MGDRTNEQAENCPACGEFIEEGQRPKADHIQRPCPHCGAILFLDYDEEEVGMGDWDWVYWLVEYK